MAVSKRTLLNHIRAFLNKSDRYAKEIYAEIDSAGNVAVRYPKRKPYGDWQSAERKFTVELEDLIILHGYYVREVDEKTDHMLEKAE